jgi:multidrug efflux pump subunit AcrA (membrane-fusion protein)
MVKSGMSATVTIRTRQEEPVLMVPSAAQVEEAAASFVFIELNGAAESRRVRTGRRIGNVTEILDGLRGGEIVIITGLGALRKGDPVNPTVVGESGTWQ